jgi:hypothetical protein
MKTYSAALLLALTSGLTGCMHTNWHTVHGSGTIVTEQRTVSQFDRVSVSGSGELTLEQGDQESLTIVADDNLLPLIRSEVRGGHLSIGPQNVNLGPTRTIHYQLHLKNLSELHLSGSLRAKAGTLKTDRLGLRISGSGRIDVAHLESRALSTDISGSGTSTAAGVVDAQNVNISGSGDHHGFELKCARADVHISGSGHAWLWVSDEMNAHISGSGRVDYRGTPSVDSHISGSGHVHHVRDSLNE